MGVKGLWKILEPAGRPVHSLESLRGARLAIDASIWLYQFSKVFSGSTVGSTTAGGYSSLALVGLVRRLCKLLYFGIKPVVVFDGAAPTLKRSTLKERREKRVEGETRYRRIAKKILRTKMKLAALDETGMRKMKTQVVDEKPVVVVVEEEAVSSESDEEGEWEEELDRVDVKSAAFTSLPVDVKQEVLLAMKERAYVQQTRVAAAHHGKPVDALAFSQQQIDALVKRRRLASELEKVRSVSPALDEVMRFKGVESGRGSRIAMNSRKEFILVKNPVGWTLDPNAERAATKPEQRESAVNVEAELGSDRDFAAMLFGSEAKGYEEQVQDEATVRLVSDTLVRSIEPLAAAKPLDLSFDPDEYLATLEQAKPPPAKALPLEIVAAEPIVARTTISGAPDRVRVESIVQSSSTKLEADESGSVSGSEVSDALAQLGDRRQVVELLQKELGDLQRESRPHLVAAQSLDDELAADFKELLRLFGIPWMVAPFEAEAQCAWLQKTGLVDGIVTDDNDALLFGGDRVYRHFFQQDTTPALFLARDLERELRLPRWKLIVLAVLLGSDYGRGVSGLGPVRAIELLGLLTVPGFEGDSRANITHLFQLLDTAFNADVLPEGLDDLQAASLKRLTDAIVLEGRLLDERIVDAFLKPAINDDPTAFKWGLPDIFGIETFLATRVRLSAEQIRSIMQPVVRRLLQPEPGLALAPGQTTLDRFLLPRQ